MGIVVSLMIQLSPHCENRHSGFVCDSMWLRCQLLCCHWSGNHFVPPPAMITFHNHLSQILSNVPSLSQGMESPVGSFHTMPPHTTQMCQLRLTLCPATRAATIIDTIDLCHLPECRVGKSKFTLTFIFLNASIVLVLFLWLLPIYGHLQFLYVVSYFNAFFMGWPFSGILREIFCDLSQITSIFQFSYSTICNLPGIYFCILVGDV